MLGALTMLIRIAALLISLLAAGPALAHAHLRATWPEADSVGPAPNALGLAFSEIVERRLSRIAVIRPDGTAVDGASLTEPGDPRRMELSLPALRPGTYTVKWVAVSVDTHRTEGSFRFTVAP
jgi:methionine-rich copper-binding protein CopC